MSSVLSRMVQGTHPLLSSIIALAGGAAGGAAYLSLPGAVFGLLVALFACAVGSMLGAAAGVGSEESDDGAATTMAACAAVPAVQLGAGDAAAAEVTESEASLMNAGRFADYHLAKAKRLFAAGNYKEAAYQASASIAHGGLGEAQEVRRKAQAALKTA